MAEFDPKTLLKLGKNLPDPWAKREAWRYTGPFTRGQRFRGLFPGFGTAAVAFAGYCVFEFMFLGGTDKHHDASAGSGSGDAH